MFQPQIRKLVYTVGHIHILTFKDNILKIIAPYFTYEPMEYAVDNEGTLKENIRLIFRAEGFILQFNKEVATLVYEGEVGDIKKSHPIIDMFFDIYEKVRTMDGFVKIKYHNINVDYVSVLEKPEEYQSLLNSNSFVHNPFNQADEFAVILELKRDNRQIKFQLGNFHESDIAKQSLSPLATEYNKELFEKKGIMAQVQVFEDTTTLSVSKLKSLINVADDFLHKYLENYGS